jgi:hypothetical protein
VKDKKLNLEITAHFFLMVAMFFNPFGFDVLFAMVMKWTNSYWITDLIFYCLSGLSFGLYFLFRKRFKNYKNEQ